MKTGRVFAVRVACLLAEIKKVEYNAVKKNRKNRSDKVNQFGELSRRPMSSRPKNRRILETNRSFVESIVHIYVRFMFTGI